MFHTLEPITKTSAIQVTRGPKRPQDTVLRLRRPAHVKTAYWYSENI